MPSGAENGTPMESNEGSSEGIKDNGSEQRHSRSPSGGGERTRKISKGGETFDKQDRDEMASLLKELNGHLGSPRTYSV